MKFKQPIGILHDYTGWVLKLLIYRYWIIQLTNGGPVLKDVSFDHQDLCRLLTLFRKIQISMTPESVDVFFRFVSLRFCIESFQRICRLKGLVTPSFAASSLVPRALEAFLVVIPSNWLVIQRWVVDFLHAKITCWVGKSIKLNHSNSHIRIHGMGEWSWFLKKTWKTWQTCLVFSWSCGFQSEG